MSDPKLKILCLVKMFDLQILLLIAEDNKLFANLSMVCKSFYTIMMEYKSKNFIEYENKYIQIVGYYDSIEYVLDGVIHRSNGPAYCYDITERWYYKGLLHRVNGPAAFEVDYFINGELHRTDGPAYNDGLRKLWCLHGVIYKIDTIIPESEEFCLTLSYNTESQRDIYVYNIVLDKKYDARGVKTIYLHKNYNKYFGEK